MGKEKDTETLFNEAAERVKKLKTKPANADLLILYGLYKQSKEGDCAIDQPWAIQVEARAKWDAWNSYKGTDTKKAMKKYIKKVEELLENDK